jgi:DNA-binding response OmpR family regulator
MGRAVARKWVLIADDDQTLRGVFKEALERQGYATLTCADGYEAFEFARTVVPHLMILDLRMERASGGLFLDYLRGSDYPILRQIPVLIVSGYLGEEHGHDEGLNVIGRFEKPVALDALLERVREVLEAETPQ